MSPEPGHSSEDDLSTFWRPTEAASWQEIAACQLGVISIADALGHGLSPAEIRWRLAAGRWQRPLSGVVVTHSGPLTHEARLWCALASIGPPSFLGGAAAAALAGLRGFPPQVVDVVVPAGRKPNPRLGVRIHRSRIIGAADIHPARRPPSTTLERAVIDMTSWARSDDDARAVLASAVQQRRTTVERLLVVHARVGRRRRSALVAQTLDDVAGGAHSVAELAYRRIERRHRLPAGTFQAPTTISGRKRFLDVCYEPWSVWVEIDGRHHAEPRQWWDDLDRQNGGVLDGRLILRFPAHLVRTQPDKVAEQVGRALRTRGWPGP